MNISTATWGEIEINDDQIYKFSKGIPGFDEEIELALIHQENGPFCYLQSTKEPTLSFMLVSPFTFCPEYEFVLSDADREELGIDEEVIVYNMVTIHHQVEQSTINLLAPLIFNPVTQTAKQVILHESVYTTRYLILNGMRSEPKSMEGGN
ncbi:flagellar assembly protein FliW [Paenibacillus sp. IHBB 10380]|uniref:flagellar assembly protein FliW n=1 Tax=Paenibacillus sp. IHBB 10380 TaxID=1566358 RepID=UPI0005CFBF33|nr:flagellar assembly protein FliW [Paenibacillus sp. IHBB 10380]AJS60373.1 flagellar assembly factor fliw [Paenibacillus sp. IHBB 10380]